VRDVAADLGAEVADQAFHLLFPDKFFQDQVVRLAPDERAGIHQVGAG
jgi:hypothetical protein